MEIDKNSNSEINDIKEVKFVNKFSKIEESLQNMKKDIQNEINKYDDIEKIISELENEVKNMKEKSGELIQKNYNSKVSIINSHNIYFNEYAEHQEQNNPFEINEDGDDIDEYSYECININELSSEIYEGKNQTSIKIILKNNGRFTWPKGNTKLVFDKDSKFIYNDIQLQEQKPEEERSYNVELSGLRNVKEGKYDFYLLFFINGIPLGERLTLSIIIKSKTDDMLIINLFRTKFNLPKDACPNEMILEQLKKYNYNDNRAFIEIINELN